MTGMIQVYTGDGKGKTTAALGLAVRAAGAGLKVFIGQFLKGRQSSELKILAEIDGIKIRQYGRSSFIYGEPQEEDLCLARKGLAEIKEILAENNYQVVILDEACAAVNSGLFSLEELMEAIDSRREGIEIVVTGRKAPQMLMDAADLVTEMKEIKHYFRRGVKARVGIEK